MKLSKFLNFKNSVLRKSNLTAIFMIFAYLPCQAELVIRASTTPFAEYAAWIATHPEDLSWIKHLESLHPAKSELAKLSLLVESSQKAFLTGSLVVAKQLFKEIADLADSNDWKSAQREAITYSMLRFAQLEKSELGRSYLRRAALFGYDVRFGRQLFPPPLFNLWKAEITRAQNKQLQISNIKDFAGFDIIKIDGRSYSLSDVESLKILPGDHRITFLGSQAQYYSQKISGSQLQVMKLNPVAVVSGTCTNPILNSEISLPITALFEESCPRSFNGQTWITLPKSELDKLDIQSLGYKHSQKNFLSDTQKTNLAPSSRKWLWSGVGLAIATSLVLIYQNNQSQIQTLGSSSGSQPTPIPSHSEGN